MTWSCTDWGGGDGDADGVGDAAAEPDGAGAADVVGEPGGAEAGGELAGDAETAADVAELDTGVGLGVPTMGWPVTREAEEVRITALATTAETNPMIRPTR